MPLKSKNKPKQNSIIEDIYKQQVLQKLILAGLNNKQILEVVNSEAYKWDIKLSELNNLIQPIKDEIRLFAQLDRQYEFGLALEQTRDLYTIVYRDKDYRTAKEIRKDLNNLQNLYEPQQIQTTNKIEIVREIVHSQIERNSKERV